MNQMFQLIGLTFHWYGLIVGLAVSLVWWLWQDLSQKYGLPDQLKRQWWLIALTALVGARSWHLITDWPSYQQAIILGDWWQLVAIWQGGLSILGALVATGLVVRWLSGKDWLKAFDVMVLTLPWGQAVGRLANWANQELYGWPTSLIWGIKIDLAHRVADVAGLAESTKFQPLFAYEALGSMILGFWLWRQVKTTKTWLPGNGKLVLGYLTGYSWLRFGLDFLRIDRGPVWQGLGANQWLLLIIGLSCLGFWLRGFDKKLSHHNLPKNFWQVGLMGILGIWLVWLGSSSFRDYQAQAQIRNFVSSQSDLTEVRVFWQHGSGLKVKLLPELPLKLTLAKTDASRSLGLGKQPFLINDGMLFVFDQPARWQFWMHDMNFSLDFIWLNNGRVVEISEYVSAPKLDQTNQVLPLLTPRTAINQVIELAAGRSQVLGIKIGDRLSFQN